MNEFFLSYLGPYSGWIMALSFGLVVVQRNAIRKRHIGFLVGITVLAFIAFFAVLLLAYARGGIPPTLLHAVMFVTAALVVGCGSAVGFWFILLSLGLTDAAGEDEDVRPASRVRRTRK